MTSLLCGENTHIQKYACCMQQDPVLLFLDNHESHCSLHVIARQNGIVMITFPPHCAHRQQPLDVAIMGTFKAKYTVTENEWMMPVLEKKEAVAYSTHWPELLEMLEVI